MITITDQRVKSLVEFIDSGFIGISGARIRCGASFLFFSALLFFSNAGIEIVGSALIIIAILISGLFLRYKSKLKLFEKNNPNTDIPPNFLIETIDNAGIGIITIGLLTAIIDPLTSTAIASPQIVVLTFACIFLLAVYFFVSKKGNLFAVDNTYAITESTTRKPEFSISTMDEKRLITYQAARLFMYAATNYRDDSGFSSHVDLNRRNASLFHSSKYLEDLNFLRWRLAVLYAGPAAEFALHKKRGSEAIDDMHEAEDIIRRILALKNSTEAFLNPANEFEAALNLKHINKTKQMYMSGLSKMIINNRESIRKIEALIKSKPVVYSEDLEPILSQIPINKLPKAKFDIVSIHGPINHDDIHIDDDDEPTRRGYQSVSKPTLTVVESTD
jgi:bacterioferritin (cytochrome b1)